MEGYAFGNVATQDSTPPIIGSKILHAELATTRPGIDLRARSVIGEV